MDGVGQSYVKTIYKETSYLATWMPNTSMKIGDVGLLQGTTFTIMGTLEGLHVPFKVRTGRKPLGFDYKSGAKVLVKPKAAVSAVPGAILSKASISVKFDKEGGIVFKTTKCFEDKISDMNEVGKKIVNLIGKKKWGPEWVVVDTLVRADSATIIVANTRSASLNLAANMSVTASDIANPNAGLSVESCCNIAVNVIANKGLSPLYRLSRVKKSFWGGLPNIHNIGPRGRLTKGVSHEGNDDFVQVLSEESPLEPVVPDWG